MRRAADWALVLLLFGICFYLVGRLEDAQTVRLSGAVTIHDGDTVTQNGRRMRLRGIDAPELDQTCRRGGETYDCGRRALSALRQLAASGAVTCSGSGSDRYGRLLAVCEAGGRDLNRAMVESGWAIAYGDYEAEERAARSSARGMWEGEFEKPARWRAMRGGMAEQPHDVWERLTGWLRRMFGRDD